MHYLYIALSSAAVYLFIILAIRLFGKQEFSQLSITDLVFVLLISNAVQNAMVGPDTSLLGGIVAAATLFVMNFLFKRLMYRFPALATTFQGKTVMLVYEGKLQMENMRRARISQDEIEEAAREHGVMHLEDINLAVLELDGNISILSNDYQEKSKHKRRKYTQVQGM